MTNRYHRPQHLSERGARFIKDFEGCVLRPYNDPLGFATIGIGHLLHRSPVTAKDRTKWAGFTEERALTLLINDAEAFSASVRTHVKAKINQAQHDALVSFAFNVGAGAFEASTLLKMLNEHPGTSDGVVGADALRQVQEQLLRWVNAGTAAEPGLRRRRMAEYHLFAAGRYA